MSWYRPDWLNHLGVAREIAAIYGTKVSPPRSWSSQQSAESLGIKSLLLEADHNDPRMYSTEQGTTRLQAFMESYN